MPQAIQAPAAAKSTIVANVAIFAARRARSSTAPSVFTAAARLQVPWDVVITAEEAGFYKPHPRLYRLALERLGVAADEAAFVAGSGYDLIGTAAVGLRTYWHNRV